MQMTRRGLLRVSAAVAAGAWLSACGGTPRHAGGITELTFVSGDPMTVVPSLIADFEASHPTIRVSYAPSQPSGTVNTVAAIVGHGAADVFWDDNPSPYLQDELCVDLSTYIDSASLAAFSSPQLQAFRRGSGLYMLPQSNAPSAFLARTDVFSSVGIAVPTVSWTYNDLADIWQSLTTPGTRVGGQLIWSPTSTFYLTGWGASLVSPTNPLECTLGSAAAIACGQWMWDRFWKDQSAAGLQGQASWADITKGSLVMEVITSAQISFAAKHYSFDWTLVPFPMWPQGSATLTTTPFYAIPVSCTQRDAAWELLQFVTSVSWEQATLAQGVSPARTSLWPSFLATLRKDIPSIASVPLEVFSTPVEDGWALPPETFTFQQAALDILNPAWTNIFGPNHTTTVPKGFAKAATAVDTAERQDASARNG